MGYVSGLSCPVTPTSTLRPSCPSVGLLLSLTSKTSVHLSPDVGPDDERSHITIRLMDLVCIGLVDDTWYETGFPVC